MKGFMMINKKTAAKKAFTLSEVLVTLAIIGVVSALTVPTLMNKYQKEANVVQLHKVYTEMSQALELIMTEEAKTKLTTTTLGARGNWSIASTAGSFLKTYFKIVNDCAADLTPCFAATYSTLNDANVSADCEGYTVTLASGAAICLYPPTAADPAEVSVDINGPKGPNIAGRDLFFFNIYSDGSIDDGVTPECKLTNACDGSASAQALRAANFASCETAGTGCFGKILNDNWKMDY